SSSTTVSSLTAATPPSSSLPPPSTKQNVTTTLTSLFPAMPSTSSYVSKPHWNFLVPTPFLAPTSS
ncbi:hypothetical protein A2U01_0097190, partial [Trifolium medium]|nr:hypothetical protein [Trifolium medium]